MGERQNRNLEAGGSTPLPSIKQNQWLMKIIKISLFYTVRKLLRIRYFFGRFLEYFVLKNYQVFSLRPVCVQEPGSEYLRVILISLCPRSSLTVVKSNPFITS